MPTELVLLSDLEPTPELRMEAAGRAFPGCTYVEYRDGDIGQFLLADGTPLLSLFRTRAVLDAGQARTAVVDPPTSFALWTDLTIPYGDATRGRALAEAIAQRVGGLVRERA